MPITTIYIVEVPVPDKVYTYLYPEGRTNRSIRDVVKNYERESIEACIGSRSSGMHSYHEVIERAEYLNKEEAKECERKLTKLMRKYSKLVDASKDEESE